MKQARYFSDLKFARITMVLQRGGFVMLRDKKGQTGLVRAAECADHTPELLKQLAQDNEILCLTDKHLSAFNRQPHPSLPCYSIPASSFEEEHLYALILGHQFLEQNPGLPKNLNLLGEREDSLPDLGCRVLKSARLIPAGLLTRLSISDPEQQIHLAENYQIPILDWHEIQHLKTAETANMEVTISAQLPLAHAKNARITMFKQKSDQQDHFAIVIGGVIGGADEEGARHGGSAEEGAGENKIPLVRLHSQCVTGDVLGSLKCDCGQQLQQALKLIEQSGYGVLLYLAQEGRDIGLLNKIRAYALQDKGVDTVEANHHLGFDTDERVFAPAAQMLRALGMERIRLLTNNPDKIDQLNQHGIEVVARLPLQIMPNPHNQNYITTKQTKTGHLSD